MRIKTIPAARANANISEVQNNETFAARSMMAFPDLMFRPRLSFGHLLRHHLPLLPHLSQLVAGAIVLGSAEPHDNSIDLAPRSGRPIRGIEPRQRHT